MVDKAGGRQDAALVQEIAAGEWGNWPEPLVL
jgi:hypothetical protein